jgi:DNA invertase Pin-like site-specific DNA recombinase
MLKFLETAEEKIDVNLFYTVDRLGRDALNNVTIILKVLEFVDEIIFVIEGKSITKSGLKKDLKCISLAAGS